MVEGASNVPEVKVRWKYNDLSMIKDKQWKRPWSFLSKTTFLSTSPLLLSQLSSNQIHLTQHLDLNYYRHKIEQFLQTWFTHYLDHWLIVTLHFRRSKWKRVIWQHMISLPLFKKMLLGLDYWGNSISKFSNVYFFFLLFNVTYLLLSLLFL
jgi:hypothetical protein